MLTPQQLLDLPGYGNAMSELRQDGRWRNVMTDTERIEWLAVNVSSMRRSDDVSDWSFTIMTDYYDPDFFRQDIDAAANKRKPHATDD